MEVFVTVFCGPKDYFFTLVVAPTNMLKHYWSASADWSLLLCKKIFRDSGHSCRKFHLILSCCCQLRLPTTGSEVQSYSEITGTLFKIKVRFSRKFVPVRGFKLLISGLKHALFGQYKGVKTCCNFNIVVKSLQWASKSVQKMTEIWLIMCGVFVVCCCSLGIETWIGNRNPKRVGLLPSSS